MASLNSKIQTFIVQQFAMYATPQEIVDLVKANFGVETTRPQVFFYNADMNPKLAQKWKDLFKKTRDEFLSDTASIAIAQRAYRLRELDKIYRNQKTAAKQNIGGMKDTLEQAAKEAGDSFSNKQKHEVTGAGGKDLGPRVITVNVVKSNSILKDE
jgi:hypothetical protein